MRPFTADDLPALVRLRADEDVRRYIGGAKMQSPEVIEQRMRFYIACQERYGYGMSLISRRADGALVGWGGLQPLEDSGETEVGYGFDKPFWGQGYATEAAAAWLRYGFERAGLERIVAIALPENVGSWRVMEKLGMRFERMTHHYGFDCVLYAITRAEFVPRASHYAVHES
jgi:RimJ/RimL family protein N-acetyltransferase